MELSLRSVKSIEWRSERWKRERKNEGRGAGRMRRNFINGDGEKLLCFGTGSAE